MSPLADQMYCYPRISLTSFKSHNHSGSGILKFAQHNVCTSIKCTVIEIVPIRNATSFAHFKKSLKNDRS